MRAAGGDDGGLRPMPGIGPVFLALTVHVVVFLGAPDAGCLHSHGGGEIGSPEAHRHKAGRGGGDFFHMGDAGGGFDDQFKIDRFLAALGGLNPGDERVNGVDVGRATDLGDHDLVDPVGAVFQHLDKVLIPVGGVETVDPDGERFVAPIHVSDGLGDVLPRLGLVVGCYGVFQIEIDDVRLRRCHFLEDRGARAGAEQLAAIGTGGRGGLETEAHLRATFFRLIRVLAYYVAVQHASVLRRGEKIAHEYSGI